MSERIAVLGLGYVGLPVALAFARRFPQTVGFDVDPQRIAELRAGHDRSGEAGADELARTELEFSSDPEALRGATFFVVAVPTPVDEQKRPDLRHLLAASKTVGSVLSPQAVVVFESTVYPGVSEEVCAPVLEAASGLKLGRDFFLAYSPERINPGDKERGLEQIVKVVAGSDAQTLDRVARVYEEIVPAGVHRAPSIKVAEAAKVIENTQRDLNIALMNELAIIFEKLDISTRDVLAAASTKWNFLPFRPGLVGGHCIGVDPYYLTTKAEELGYQPQVILAGRRINDSMGHYLAQRLVKSLVKTGRHPGKARVGVLGLSFKENVPDLRNSQIPAVLSELHSFGIQTQVHDPLADPKQAKHDFGVELSDFSTFSELDALVLAVPHRAYRELPIQDLLGCVSAGGVLVDVKSVLDPGELKKQREDLLYWAL